MFFASIAVNELLARLHACRNLPNSDLLGTRGTPPAMEGLQVGIAEIVERILAGFSDGHAQLEPTLAALRANCDDVPLPYRDSFFTHLLLRPTL